MKFADRCLILTNEPHPLQGEAWREIKPINPALTVSNLPAGAWGSAFDGPTQEVTGLAWRLRWLSWVSGQGSGHRGGGAVSKEAGCSLVGSGVSRVLYALRVRRSPFQLKVGPARVQVLVQMEALSMICSASPSLPRNLSPQAAGPVGRVCCRIIPSRKSRAVTTGGPEGPWPLAPGSNFESS